MTTWQMAGMGSSPSAGTPQRSNERTNELHSAGIAHRWWALVRTLGQTLFAQAAELRGHA